MWSSIENLKQNLSKIALDVHNDDDEEEEELGIYGSGNGDESSVSDRRSSHGFAHSKSVSHSPLPNGTDEPYSFEIEQYRAEIKRLKESEAEIKALSVNYAAILKEKEDQINRLSQENGSLKQNLDATRDSLNASRNENMRASTNSFNVLKGSGDQSPKRLNRSTSQIKSRYSGNQLQNGAAVSIPTTMNPVTVHAPPSSPWMQMIAPSLPPSSSFWDTRNVHNQLRELQETLALAKAMKREVELLMAIKDTDEPSDQNACALSKYLEDRGIDLETQEKASLEAANSVILRLQAQLEPFRLSLDQTVPWEDKSAAARLSDKILKSKRNKRWRKRKRKRSAELRAKDMERFEEADREADEWRAREIAKDAAQMKVEKMKQIAKVKAKEERKRLESELELVLIVEKLQELRSIRIQKLKKQGHFLPEEDNEFLERVQAAVEEEERQAMAAAGTDAAKDAIATAEESRKTNQSSGPISKDSNDDNGGLNNSQDENRDSIGSGAVTGPSEDKGSKVQSYGGKFDSIANLPIEFYHYYHGSNNDIGTLIEVRRTWDAYVRQGGSRIPGHWVQAPPPANDIWASYLKPQ